MMCSAARTPSVVHVDVEKFVERLDVSERADGLDRPGDLRLTSASRPESQTIGAFRYIKTLTNFSTSTWDDEEASSAPSTSSPSSASHHPASFTNMSPAFFPRQHHRREAHPQSPLHSSVNCPYLPVNQPGRLPKPSISRHLRLLGRGIRKTPDSAQVL